MKQVGDYVSLDGVNYVVTQITLNAKTLARKVVLQEIQEVRQAETEHGVKLSL